MAQLPCTASGGEPAPSIRWYKNGRLLMLAEPRFILLDSGTLQIGGGLYSSFVYQQLHNDRDTIFKKSTDLLALLCRISEGIIFECNHFACNNDQRPIGFCNK
jgi:CD80-like C2-set immunoglobulin domain